MEEQNIVAIEQGKLAQSRWIRLIPLIFITYSLAPGSHHEHSVAGN